MTLEKKVDALEKLYGCQSVWKIEQWADKIHEAKLGRKSTLFSPPFLTSRHGYKMAMSLCPYGDGKGIALILNKNELQLSLPCVRDLTDKNEITTIFY